MADGPRHAPARHASTDHDQAPDLLVGRAAPRRGDTHAHTSKRARNKKEAPHHPHRTPPALLNLPLSFFFSPQTRLAKFYVPLTDAEQRAAEADVFRATAGRDARSSANVQDWGPHKLVARRYAGLAFAACIDAADPELAALEAIHLFVEVLDHYFGAVCELDLVFNFHKVSEGEGERERERRGKTEGGKNGGEKRKRMEAATRARVTPTSRWSPPTHHLALSPHRQIGLPHPRRVHPGRRDPGDEQKGERRKERKEREKKLERDEGWCACVPPPISSLSHLSLSTPRPLLSGHPRAPGRAGPDRDLSGERERESGGVCVGKQKKGGRSEKRERECFSHSASGCALLSIRCAPARGPPFHSLPSALPHP